VEEELRGGEVAAGDDGCRGGSGIECGGADASLLPPFRWASLLLSSVFLSLRFSPAFFSFSAPTTNSHPGAWSPVR
jgi:hypothetical protein